MMWALLNFCHINKKFVKSSRYFLILPQKVTKIDKKNSSTEVGSFKYFSHQQKIRQIKSALFNSVTRTLKVLENLETLESRVWFSRLGFLPTIFGDDLVFD